MDAAEGSGRVILFAAFIVWLVGACSLLPDLSDPDFEADICLAVSWPMLLAARLVDPVTDRLLLPPGGEGPP